MRFHHLLAVTVLGVAACAEPITDELSIEGEATDEGKADHVSVPTTELAADVSSARREQGGTFIMTSRAAWTRLMGTTPPASVDFSKEWVVFYGTGLKNTGGFSAEVTGLRYSASLGALVLSTHATSPGPDCIVTQAFTTPHQLVKFAIPSPRPLYALANRSSEVRRCSPTNAERLVELAESRQAWDAAKAAHGNSYTYRRELHSWSGFTSATTFVVTGGVVTERHYKAQYASGGDAITWSEVGAEVGSRPEGYPARLVDELYDECRTRVLTQDETKNWISFSLDERGLLQACTYWPMACQDDCARGPVISSLEF